MLIAELDLEVLAVLTLYVAATGVTLGVLFPERAAWLGSFLLGFTALVGGLLIAWTQRSGQGDGLFLGGILIGAAASVALSWAAAKVLARLVAVARVRRARELAARGWPAHWAPILRELERQRPADEAGMLERLRDKLWSRTADPAGRMRGGV